MLGLTTDASSQRPPSDDGQPRQRPNLFRALGLSEEQVQQIRAANEEIRPKMSEVTRKLRDANRELDRTIYADEVDEAEFAKKLEIYRAAQAEMSELRFNSELAVRRILTSEQLIKFRELRQNFAREREREEGRRDGDPPQRGRGSPRGDRPDNF